MSFDEAIFYYLQEIDDGEAIKGDCESCGRKSVMVIFTEYESDGEIRTAWWCVDWAACCGIEEIAAVEPVEMEIEIV